MGGEAHRGSSDGSSESELTREKKAEAGRKGGEH